MAHGDLDDGLLEPGAALGVALTVDELRDAVLTVLPGFDRAQRGGLLDNLADAVAAAQVNKLATSDSGLVAHARRELELAGNDDSFNATLVAAVHAFAQYGHSGGSAAVAVELLGRLLRFEPLTSHGQPAGADGTTSTEDSA